VSEHEVIDHETGELLPAVREPAVPANLFGTDQPSEVIERAGQHAKALDDVIRQRSLYKRIGDKDHILVEGWTLLGSMLGVFPIVVWTHEIENGFEARVEARTLAGAIVGAAEAQCTRDENLWKNRDAYALRSMAQTRAISKALRGPLGFIVQLAGFNATPAEEMPEPQPSSDTGERPSKEDFEYLTAMIKRLDDEASLPLGHDSWTAFAKHSAEEKYGVTVGPREKLGSKLTAAQVRELTTYLETYLIPL
jgi:hypothetical protein